MTVSRVSGYQAQKDRLQPFKSPTTSGGSGRRILPFPNDSSSSDIYSDHDDEIVFTSSDCTRQGAERTTAAEAGSRSRPSAPSDTSGHAAEGVQK